MLKSLFYAIIVLMMACGASHAVWPKEIKSSAGEITIYQPQIISYQKDSLSFRTAISVSQPGGAEPVYGAVWLECLVQTDRPTRTVTLESVKVKNIKFPNESAADAKNIVSILEKEIPEWDLSFSLDELLISLDVTRKEKEETGNLLMTPPKIILTDHPAALVPIDGEPVFADIEGTALRQVVNTPFFLVEDTASGFFWLKGLDNWFTAKDIEGPWQPSPTPPEAAADLALKSAGDSATNGEVANGPSGKIPEIVVSTEPAELIATDGAIAFSPIEGTDLLYAINTPDKLFMQITTQDYFILISGRWYSARSLNGPWTYVESKNLPADFTNIPPGSESDGVLANVAGTAPAHEADEDAQIPQMAYVDRSSATDQVDYDGDPDFEDISNTIMEYALNSSSPVILIGNTYYNCSDGVWFDGQSPYGPWAVCVKVPDLIYTIPPNCPVYYVRFVYVYSYTPEYACVGYTPGYTGCFVYHGSVIYGTGYHYHYWYRRLYFARPFTWGFAFYYDPVSGWSTGYATASWITRPSGWWGPERYRPPYIPPSGHIYREGFHPAKVTGQAKVPTVYDNWKGGVYRMAALKDNAGKPYAAEEIKGKINEHPYIKTYAHVTPLPSKKENDVFVSPEGKILRSTPGGWQQQNSRGWAPARDVGNKNPVNIDRQIRSQVQQRTSGGENVKKK